MKHLATLVTFLLVLVVWPAGAAPFAPHEKPVVGVLLSGSGIYDGSEIQEAVLALAALDRRGAEIVAMAPNIPQADVIDHVTQAPAAESRNVLVESARIVRGAIRDIKDVKAQDLDALVIPGGMGTIKNLSTFASEGANCQVSPEVERLIQEMLAARKPIGSLCISPVIVARVAGKLGIKPRLTIGNDQGIANAIVAMGAEHVNSQVTEVVVDRQYNIVTTPAFMLAQSISEVAFGIEKLVHEVVMLAHPRHHR